MNPLEKLLLSPWFWADIFLSISGGLVVAWGLSVEKKAENMLPPNDFKKDIFGDIVEKHKAEVERGWRILMAGIIIEVVAALVISVISGFEIADLTDQSAAANLEAKQAGTNAAASYLEAKLAETNAAASNERAAKFDSDRVMVEKEAEEIRSTNLLLSIELEKLKNPRIISPENTNKFIQLLRNNPKIPIRVFSIAGDNGSYRYASQIRKMLDDAGYTNNGEGVVEQTGTPRELENAPPFSEYDIGTYWYGTNKTMIVTPIPNIYPDANGNPVVLGTNSMAAFRCVEWAFQQIQILPDHGENDFLLKPGEFGIFVPSKNH